MVSEVVLSAFVGGVAGSMITAIVQIYTTKKQQRAETERQVAEFYAGRKVETLTNLHSTLDRCCRVLDDYYKKNSESVTESDYHDEVTSSLEEYERALSQASIFLDEIEREQMDETLSELRLGVMSIQDKALSDGREPRKIDWDELNSVYDEAREVLRSQMNDPIEELES